MRSCSYPTMTIWYHYWFTHLCEITCRPFGCVAECVCGQKCCWETIWHLKLLEQGEHACTGEGGVQCTVGVDMKIYIHFRRVRHVTHLYPRYHEHIFNFQWSSCRIAFTVHSSIVLTLANTRREHDTHASADKSHSLLDCVDSVGMMARKNKISSRRATNQVAHDTKCIDYNKNVKKVNATRQSTNTDLKDNHRNSRHEQSYTKSKRDSGASISPTSSIVSHRARVSRRSYPGITSV